MPRSFFTIPDPKLPFNHNIVQVYFLKVNAEIMMSEQYYPVKVVRGWIIKYLRGPKKRLFTQMKKIRGKWVCENYVS